MEPSTKRIQLAHMQVSQLHAIFRKLRRPYQKPKNDLILELAGLLAEPNHEIVSRAIIEVYNAGNQAGGIRQHSAAMKTTPAMPVPQLSTIPNEELRKCTDETSLRRMEMDHHQGLLDSCRILGAMVVERKHPHVNTFATGWLSEEDIAGVGADARLVIRFFVYNPQTGTWLIPPIWPKEGRLVFSDETVFDTTPRNALNFSAAGHKDPSPVVDVSPIALKRNPKGGSLKVEFATTSIPSNVRWVVVAELVKRKTWNTIVDMIVQQSPSAPANTERMLKFFSEERGVAVETCELSLKDPASYAPIEIAVRGRACTHLQCFDLFTYLELNEKAREPKWKCPICGDKVRVTNIVMDSWFQGVVNWKNTYMSNSSRFLIGSNGEADVLPEDRDDDIDDEDEDEDTIPSTQETAKRPRIDSSSSRSIVTGVGTLGTVQPVVTKKPTKRGKSKDDAIELLDDDDVLY